MFGRKRRERRQRERLRAWEWQQSAWDWQQQNPGRPLMQGVITRDSQHIIWNGPAPSYEDGR